MRPPVRSLILFLTGLAALAVALFLFLAGFFSQWEGRVVSVRDNDAEKAMVQVLVADDADTRFELAWPRPAITGVKLAIDPLALPPKTLPEGLPTTKKERYSLSFELTPDGGEARTVQTNKAAPLGVALLFFFLTAALRNMIVAGSPFSIEPSGVTLPKAQAQAGSVAPTQGGGSQGGNRKPQRAKKGPPPSKKRRGGGRRRK